MKKLVFLVTIVAVGYICSASGGKGGGEWEGEESFSPAMIHLRVDHTLKEHERQKEMNSNQSKNLGMESTNKTMWGKFKDVTKDIQDRLRKVDFVLQAIPTGYVITEKTKEIYQTQKSIYAEIKTAPKYLQKVLPKQIKFYDDLQMIVRYMTGIVVSYGAINQMERAERQILLDHALAEVNSLSSSSFATLMLIRDAKMAEQFKKAELKYYAERDKALVNDILRKIKKF
ncbi:MAG: hypothetical protein Q3983_07650 [Capnocytophaga sp.]|nr:hypothetical protein [Capnocytophaga sp.]